MCFKKKKKTRPTTTTNSNLKSNNDVESNKNNENRPNSMGIEGGSLPTNIIEQAKNEEVLIRENQNKNLIHNSEIRDGPINISQKHNKSNILLESENLGEKNNPYDQKKVNEEIGGAAFSEKSFATIIADFQEGKKKESS